MDLDCVKKVSSDLGMTLILILLTRAATRQLKCHANLIRALSVMRVVRSWPPAIITAGGPRLSVIKLKSAS